MEEWKVIGHIKNAYREKFGVPRQSGLVPDLISRVVMEPAYRVPEAFRGLSDFSHIWLVWEFDKARRPDWSPTVRPPRLGGNTRLGVFATRSPFRPNPIGLSCVRLLEVCLGGEEGPSLLVGGADLMDGTPIYDIKPYLPYADAHPEASGGFTDTVRAQSLRVEIPVALAGVLPNQERLALCEILSQDPRPRYQDDPNRVYGMKYGRWDIRFRVEGDVLYVVEIVQTG